MYPLRQQRGISIWFILFEVLILGLTTWFYTGSLFLFFLLEGLFFCGVFYVFHAFWWRFWMVVSLSVWWFFCGLIWGIALDLSFHTDFLCLVLGFFCGFYAFVLHFNHTLWHAYAAFDRWIVPFEHKDQKYVLPKNTLRPSRSRAKASLRSPLQPRYWGDL